MARMPGAQWQGEHGSRPMLAYDIVCMHTIVGRAPAHAAHFSVAGNGRIIQSRDTRFRSAANLNGNHRVIAIENEDHGPDFPLWNTGDGHAVPALTDEQVESNAEIFAWAHDEHGVPLQLCPDSRPASRGLAYHRQGIDGNFGPFRFPGRVSGGEVWTEHRGKVCPGDRRIAQRPEVLSRAREIAGVTEEEISMADIDKLLAELKRVREQNGRIERKLDLSRKRLMVITRAITVNREQIPDDVVAELQALEAEEAQS